MGQPEPVTKTGYRIENDLSRKIQTVGIRIQKVESQIADVYLQQFS